MRAFLGPCIAPFDDVVPLDRLGLQVADLVLKKIEVLPIVGLRVHREVGEIIGPLIPLDHMRNGFTLSDATGTIIATYRDLENAEDV